MVDKEMESLIASPEAQAWAAVASVLVKFRGMTAEQAVAEVVRMKGRS